MLLRIRRLLQASLLSLLSVLAALAAIESALALFPPRATFRDWYASSYTYLEDDAVDWRLAPRSYPWGRVNRDGFRGREIPIEKDSGSCRVIVLGGSAAFDLWKRDGETWSDQLEERLAAALPCKVEVMNTGTPGYSTWQALRLLETRLLRWRPDLVLIYELYNDSLAFRHDDRQQIIDGWKLNARANAIGWPAHPNAALDLVAALFPRSVDFARLRAVQLLSARRLRENARFWWDPQLSGRVQPAGLRFYEENLTRMARLLRANGDVPLGIVTQATLIRESNSDQERRFIHYLYRGLDHAQLWAGYQAAWEINRAVARREPNAFLIEAQRAVPASLEFFHDEVHLNADGSRLLASAIADALLERFAAGAEASGVDLPEGHSLPALRCLGR